MYKTCPKCGHTRTAADKAPEGTCPACGIIFEKWLKSRFRTQHSERPRESSTVSLPVANWWSEFRELAMQVTTPVNPVVFYASCAGYLIFFVWGWYFIFTDYAYYQAGTRIDDPIPEIGQSFMHNINLVFHEAGHVLFRPFGYFMTILGGSLFQILMPLIVTGAFLFKEHNPFSASIGLCWTAQSMMDIAPYINDARNGQIMLLGGATGAETTGYHDWETLLTLMNIMEKDHAIADTVDGIGVLLMLLSFAWGGTLLYRQYRAMR